MTINDRKAFGVFVGFINKTNGSKISVKEALLNDSLINLFQANLLVMEKMSEKKLIKTSIKSTKRLSLDQVKQNESERKIIECLHHNKKPMSRFEISQELGLRVSSVAGRVFNLIQAGTVEVCGYTTDSETNRKVEVIQLRAS